MGFLEGDQRIYSGFGVREAEVLRVCDAVLEDGYSFRRKVAGVLG